MSKSDQETETNSFEERLSKIEQQLNELLTKPEETSNERSESNKAMAAISKLAETK